MPSRSPSRQQVPARPDSPVFTRNFHCGPSHQIRLLQESRSAVLQDLGSTIPQVPLQTFFHFLAPLQPDFDIEGTLETLKLIPRGIPPNSTWWRTFDKDQSGREDTVFMWMSNIFDSVSNMIIKNSNSKLTVDDRMTHFLLRPSMVASTDFCGESDGYLVLKHRLDSKMVSWTDVVLSCEYKQNDGIKEFNDVSTHCGLRAAVLSHLFRTCASAC
jgi:hypothetical protein